MRTRLFYKSARREVKSSLGRFFSLMVISFLGAGVFAGLWAVAPNMERVGDEYYSSQNVHDVRLLSTYGFTDADVDAIRQVDGVSGVMASHYVDASGAVGDKDYTFRVDGLPSSATQSDSGTSDDADYINQMTLVEGHMPQADNECVIVQSSTGLKNIEVGSTIKLSDGSGSSLDDTLANRELTVVGVVDSADYVSFTVGNTNVGSGTINYVLYVPDSNFTVDGYTDLYVTVDGASSLDQFRQAYLDKVAQTTTSLDELKQERQTLRHDSLWNDLNSAWDEYNAKKADADQSLADALDQLNQGADQIASARDQYAAGQAEYDEKSASAQQQLSSAADQLASAAQQIDAGQSQIDSKESEYSSGANQLTAARQTLDAGESQYSENYAAYQQAASELVSAREQLDAAEQTYSDNLATWQQNSDEYEAGEKSYSAAADKLSQQRSALDEKQQQYQTALQAAQAMEEGSQKQALLSQLEQTKAQLDAAESAYSSAADELSQKRTSLDAAKQQLADGKARLDSAQTAIQQEEQEYSTKSAQLAQAKQQLGAAAATISSGEAEYAQKAATLAAARSELDAAEQKLASARQTYQQNYEAYESAKQSASSQLEEAKAQLDSAKQQIDEAQQELDQKQSEYDQAKADADQQLQDAYDELTNKQSTLQSMGDAKWYVFNRTKNEGYVMYKNDVERMQSLATVFPIIYLVVAALVCLSTMTRMVEEERTLIGTFKALGFSNAVIASRYLTYAALASVVGGVLGTLVGFQAIPLIIWHAFSIAYVLPDLQPAVYVGIGAAAVAAMSAVTLVATLVTVMGSLRETPASLMRPKAPKRGKRVLLERITPLWNRLSFTQKVTFRNLFLNKRRLVTTLVGIAGCTALVVAACGTYARVNTILSDQFDGVWHYDATVGYSMSDDSTSNAANAADDAASNEGSVPDDVNQVLGNSALVSDSIRVSSSSWEAAATNNVDESSSSDKAKSITIVTPDDASKIESFITMYDPDTGEDVPFSDDSVVITEKLSMLLDAHAGDTIWVKSVTGDDWYELTVTGGTRNYTMNYVYLGKNAYAQALGEEPTFDRSYVKLADGASSDDLTSALSGASDLSFVSYTSDLSGNISTSISSVNVIVLVLVVTSGLLAFVVIYNLTTINVGERKRELATLKVLGFFDRECYSYILREIWITSAMGIAIGLFAGRYLYDAILTTVEPDMVLLLRTVPIHSYFVAAGLMLGFTWLVNQFVKPSIKGIDMLESLKSVE